MRIQKKLRKIIKNTFFLRIIIDNCHKVMVYQIYC